MIIKYLFFVENCTLLQKDITVSLVDIITDIGIWLFCKIKATQPLAVR